MVSLATLPIYSGSFQFNIKHVLQYTSALLASSDSFLPSWDVCFPGICPAFARPKLVNRWAGPLGCDDLSVGRRFWAPQTCPSDLHRTLLPSMANGGPVMRAQPARGLVVVGWIDEQETLCGIHGMILCLRPWGLKLNTHWLLQKTYFNGALLKKNKRQWDL